MFPISFRLRLREFSTYHRTTPWLIGFILGYFLHKYQQLATPQKLEDLRNRTVTWRKVRAIGTPVTNCQCDRAGCLTSQHTKKNCYFVVFSVPRCDVHCCTWNLTNTISLHMYTNFLFKHYRKIWRNIYVCIYTGCPRRNVRDFGRVFLMLNYTDITKNTYVQSRTVTEIIAREKCGRHKFRHTVRRPWRHTCPMRLPDN